MVYITIKKVPKTINKKYRKKVTNTRKRRMHKRMQGGSNTKIKLFNWWGFATQSERDTCIALLERLLAGCIDKYDEIHFYSVYPVEAQIPPLEPATKVLRIQYSGEDYFKDPSRFHVNCIPGEHPTTNNFLIFPQMPFYMKLYNINTSDFIISRKYESAQPKFCLFSISNGGIQERNNFYNELTKYKKVDSCGNFMNNLGYNCPGSFVSKEYHEFISQYKFMICFENKSMKNYLTEKLIIAYKSRTIPIYWGCPNLEDYINVDAILYLKPGYTDDDVKALIKEIEILDKDPALYKKKYESIFFKNGVVPDSFNMEKLNLEMCKRVSSLADMNLMKGGKIRKMKGGQEPKTFYFYNRMHYGDNILNLKFFYVNTKLLKEKGIQIHYYYDSVYIKDVKELERYVDPAVVHLHPLSEKPESAIELWMNNKINNIYWSNTGKYFNEFYKQILSYIGLADLKIDTSLYQKEDYLLDLYEKLDPKFKDIDVFLLNNEPASGQFDFDKTTLDALANRLLSKKLKVVVLKPVGDIPSTNADGLSLQDIGAISTHAKYIIGINTGALTPCFNSYTKNYVKKWIIFCKYGTKFDDIDAVVLAKPEDVNTADRYIQ